MISCGYKNYYGFPRKSVLKTYKSEGIKVYRTDLNGNITILTDGIGYSITKDK